MFVVCCKFVKVNDEVTPEDSMHSAAADGAVVHAYTGEALVSDASSSNSSSNGGDSLDEWIMSNLQQHKLRRARVASLTKAAKPFQYENAEVLLVIGTRMSTSVK